MTRHEQAKRRQEILEAVAGGERRSAVALRLNLCRGTVDKACKGQGFLTVRGENEQLWIARHLHRRITALSKRRGHSMVQVANALILQGLTDSREDREPR